MLETARWRTMSPPICRPAGNTLSRVRPRDFQRTADVHRGRDILSRAQPRITRSPLTRRPVGSPSSLGQFWSSRSPSTCRSSGRLRRSASLMTVRCRRGAAALGAELTRARGPARPPERREAQTLSQAAARVAPARGLAQSACPRQIASGPTRRRWPSVHHEARRTTVELTLSPDAVDATLEWDWPCSGWTTSAEGSLTSRNKVPSSSKSWAARGGRTSCRCPVSAPSASTKSLRLKASLGIEATARIITSPWRHIVEGRYQIVRGSARAQDARARS